MSSGRVHTAGNLAGLVLGGIATYALLPDLGADGAAAAVAGLVGGLLFTPDLDHHALTDEERRIEDIASASVVIAYRLAWAPCELAAGVVGRQGALYGLMRVGYILALAAALRGYAEVVGANEYMMIGAYILFAIWAIWVMKSSVFAGKKAMAAKQEEALFAWVTSATISRLYRLYWLPYEKMLPHRSPLSHFPGISTAIRMVFVLAPIVAVVLATVGFTESIDWAWVVGCGFVGWTIQDAIHWILDDFGRIR